MYKLLDSINKPADFRDFSIEQLNELCAEVRDYMIRCCAVNPGHLGSSLGAVELITALHYVYDTPNDKIIFDVGHQAYAHKILTGRKEAFKGNRTKGGISGFPRIDESPYDAFGVGHSSTSISAALGLAKAAELKKEGRKVVAVIGDGAMTGGLAFEGLNNAGAANSDLLIILNDNNQSIDGNLGAVHNYLLRITSGHSYNVLKQKIWETVGEGQLRKFLQKITKDAKSNLVRKTGGDLFESLGFRYFGPIDGNDMEQLVTTLRRLSKISGPRILHIHTLKGKGFAPAEQDPTTWHAPGKFDPETGERVPAHYPADRYQDVFGEVLLDLAKKDDRVVGITPAMSYGCGMSAFAKEMPQRFFDVGIEEEHAVTFSAGLAAGGMRPFCNIYSSFSQRAYDQIIHDVALQNLPVVLCFDRGGLVGEDGATHHGCYDLAAYRSIPGTTIAAPSNETELKNLMYSGLHNEGGPYIIRYPRGCGEGTPWRESEYRLLEKGKGEQLRPGSDIAILVLGPFCRQALAAAERLSKEEGIEASVYDMRFLKPIDTSILEKAAASKYGILTVEEGTIKGGLFGEVAERMVSESVNISIKGIGIPDKFVTQDRQSAQRKEYGLDEEGIFDVLTKMCKKLQKVLENKN
ncbi:MAG: 1-deoxy-D-xylulose-5-phosphate synthase [Bacteroidales bacterium]|nr:1-deoxy-D-xylulose-5-phosphate synthase [Bacteroidales bacterium]